jgi:hypothetical protein
MPVLQISIRSYEEETFAACPFASPLFIMSGFLGSTSSWYQPSLDYSTNILISFVLLISSVSASRISLRKAAKRKLKGKSGRRGLENSANQPVGRQVVAQSPLA